MIDENYLNALHFKKCLCIQIILSHKVAPHSFYYIYIPDTQLGE